MSMGPDHPRASSLVTKYQIGYVESYPRVTGFNRLGHCPILRIRQDLTSAASGLCRNGLFLVLCAREQDDAQGVSEDNQERA